MMHVHKVLAFALVGLVGVGSAACVPAEDCTATATCSPERTDASLDVTVSKDATPFSAADASLRAEAAADVGATRLEGGSVLTSSDGNLSRDGSVLAADVAVTTSCSVGTKRCSEQCVAIDDPSFGCTVSSCDRSGCPDAGPGTLVCQNGACVVGACGEGKKNCGGACVATIDPTYGCTSAGCDACARVSGAMLVCQAGACAIGTCAAGMKKCGDRCVAIDDPNFGCGAATCDRTSCPAVGAGSLMCSGGLCVVGTCGAGTKKCNGQCVATDDPKYGCGATTCDASSCPAPGAGTLVCAGGSCVVGTCGAGTKKCGNTCVPLDRNNGCSDLARCTACAASETCVGSPSVCTCVSNNDACTAMGKNCGSVVDNCGKTVSCGVCVSPQTCGGAGTANKCGCTAKACTPGQCGKVPDGCGGTVDCGMNCGGASCSGTSLVAAGTCSAAGACSVPTAQPCPGHFACAGGACKAACTSSADCEADYFCSGEDQRCHSDVISIASGGDHDCAALKDGRVVCWGSNNNGQLGNGMPVASRTTPVQAAGISNAVLIRAGEWNSCALTADGRVFCWGNVSSGFGTPTPAPLFTAAGSPLTGVRTLALGFDAGCAGTDGATFCWGAQSMGSLGLDASLSLFSVATLVPGAGVVASLGMGQGLQVSSYGNNRICPWGSNSANAVSADDVGLTYPVPQGQCFTVASTVAEVAVGQYINCYRLVNGAVGCWGSNFAGALGSGSVAASVPPPGAPVAGRLTASILTVGQSHGCAVPTANARSVVCWGDRNLPGSDAAPVPVNLGLAPGLTITHLGSGMHSVATCAILSDGSPVCWAGSNILPSAATW